MRWLRRWFRRKPKSSSQPVEPISYRELIGAAQTPDADDRLRRRLAESAERIRQQGGGEE